ncbi:hypothetical protein ABR737_00890 [Streptomyces sp. Edi2]|uniref:hypothetical protein n=1 Tax=Streptomyces sp. Edi2 TaxID=3162528 RepID=UPI003305683A
MKTSLWPPRTRDGSRLVHAYTDLLDWRLVAGSHSLSADEAAYLLSTDSHAVVETLCEKFDAVTVSGAVGRDALMWLDREGANVPLIPSFQDGSSVTFLVQPGTARHLQGLDAVTVVSGPDGRVALPPTPGVRWDTPPWHARTPARIELADAQGLRPGLERALHLHGRS